MHFRTILSLVVSIWISCLLLACHNSGESKLYTIAFSQCIGNDAWRETMLKEMKRELSFHPEIRFLYTDANGNSQKQIQQLKQLSKQSIDLLIISPNEADPLTPTVDSLFRKGLPVIVTDRKTSSGLYNAYVGSDNFDIGNIAGKYLGNLLKGKGKIALVTGLPGSSASMERERGLLSALKQYPAIQLIEKLNGQWLKTVAAQAVRTKAEALHQLDAIFAFNDQMAIGTEMALTRLYPDCKTKIIGVDALPGRGNGLENILKRNIHASLLYPTGGAEAIRTAMAILKKQAYQRDNILNTLVIDSNTVELMLLQANKIDKQQQDIDKQQGLLTEQKQIYHSQQSTLNILIISLVSAIIFAGIAIFSLKSNWEKNKHLEAQNAEILDQQKQLILMSGKVKEASEAKINFFTNISHEFKTPLTLILAPLEDLLNEKVPQQSFKDSLLLIKRNAIRLMNRVSELIDFQRLEHEKIKLRASPQSLIKFLNQIVLSFRPLAIQNNILLLIENKSPIRELWFDQDLMEKVMYNLLSNAVKFTPKNGKIQIRIESNIFGDHIMIRVIDNGKGIGRLHIEHIFDPFYQGIRHNGGSGLGLALVKEIVELHHGQITVSSKEGEGTSFTIRLPVGDDHLSSHEKADNLLELPRKELHANFLPLLDASHTGTENKANQNKEFSLLIIDDNEEILAYLSNRFSDTYHIYTAYHAEEGLKKVFAKVPDLIICDVVMPRKSGIELIQILKQDTRSSSIPVILLTALADEEHRTQGLLAMADAYLTKPFNINHLEVLIQNLIKTRKALRQRYIGEVLSPIDLSPSTLNEVDRRFLNDLSAIVENHIEDSHFGVDDIAKEIGMSRVQLYRKVKGLMTCSVNDYIVNKRLKKSKHFLLQDLSISEVAVKTGFSSQTYFSTLFKAKYGVSPSNFKQQLQKKDQLNS